jgi:hypothetical protein
MYACKNACIPVLMYVYMHTCLKTTCIHGGGYALAQDLAIFTPGDARARGPAVLRAFLNLESGLLSWMPWVPLLHIVSKFLNFRTRLLLTANKLFSLFFLIFGGFFLGCFVTARIPRCLWLLMFLQCASSASVMEFEVPCWESRKDVCVVLAMEIVRRNATNILARNNRWKVMVACMP